jgi:hypothetical protein
LWRTFTVVDKKELDKLTQKVQDSVRLLVEEVTKQAAFRLLIIPANATPLEITEFQIKLNGSNGILNGPPYSGSLDRGDEVTFRLPVNLRPAGPGFKG